MHKAFLPLIALFFANLIYAINYGLAKDVMGEGYLQAFSFILFRVVGAVFLFWIVSFFTKKTRIQMIIRQINDIHADRNKTVLQD